MNILSILIRLDCFTPAGTFDGAHAIKNFLKASHLICLDYDHVPNVLDIISRCAADPHTVTAIESPTDGLKVFAYVDDIEGQYREGQKLVSQYYDRLLNLVSDPACKDESRLCYFTYSPNGYIASLYEPFTIESLALHQTNFTLESEEQTPEEAPKEQELPKQATSDEDVNKFLSSYIFLQPLTVGYRHTHLFKLACEACRRGYSEEAIVRELTAILKPTDFPINELKSDISSGYKQVSK